jgi:hypothetical protein
MIAGSIEGANMGVIQKSETLKDEEEDDKDIIENEIIKLSQVLNLIWN